MNEQTQKEYFAPAIVLEMELETRAGSSLGEVFDELLEE
jgi:hypothetical protein